MEVPRLVLLVALTAGSVVSQPESGGAVRLPAPKKIMSLPAGTVPESSGLARSLKYPGVFWTHNDSGSRAELLAVDPAAGSVRAVALPGVENEDWEDLAADEQGRLVIGDVGDNALQRKTLQILRLPEPDPDGNGPAAAPEVFRFRYPKDVGAADAEALVAASGSAWVFTKEKGRTRVFRVGLPDRPPTAPAEAALAGETRSISFVTGAALSPDRKRLALLTYLKVSVITLACPWGDAPADAAAAATDPFAGLIRERPILLGQAEAVCFDIDDLVISTECVPGTKRGAALFRLGPIR